MPDDYKLQFSTSSNGPMLNVRADSPSELAALLSGVTADEVAQALAAGAEMYRAVLALAPLTASYTGSAGTAAAASASTPTPADDLAKFFSPADLVCPVHGPRKLYSGIGKNGAPYANAKCAADRNCPTKWGKV